MRVILLLSASGLDANSPKYVCACIYIQMCLCVKGGRGGGQKVRWNTSFINKHVPAMKNKNMGHLLSGDQQKEEA